MEMPAWQTKSYLAENCGEEPCSAWLPYGLAEFSEPHNLEPHHEHGHALSECMPQKKKKQRNGGCGCTLAAPSVSE